MPLYTQHVILNTHAYTKCPPRKRQSNLDQETHCEGCLNQCKNGISKHYCLVLKYWWPSKYYQCLCSSRRRILRQTKTSISRQTNAAAGARTIWAYAGYLQSRTCCPRFSSITLPTQASCQKYAKKTKTPKWGVHKDFKWFHIDLMDAFGNTFRQPQLLQPLKFHRQAQAWQDWQRFHSIRKHSIIFIIFIILCFKISAVVISWCFA